MNKIIEVYTDGSHQKSKVQAVTYGGLVFLSDQKRTSEKHLQTMSGTIDVVSFFERYKVYVSNPTAELYAAAVALQSLSQIPNATITIYSDYKGVQEWITGRWNAKKPYIADLVSFCRDQEKKAAEIGTAFRYVHVKGHAGNHYNEMADGLCNKDDHNNFGEFVKTMQLSKITS